jgi:hypothetical protein
MMHSGDNLDQSGFARSIVPGQSQNLARIKCQRNLFKRVHAAKSLRDVFDVQQRDRSLRINH